MNKWQKLAIMCVVGLGLTAGALALFASRPLLSQGQVGAQAAWLDNAGFEEPYESWDGQVVRKVAQGWSLWYQTIGEGTPYAGQSTIVHSGGILSRSQKLYTHDNTTFDACVYQQVEGITVGHTLRFSVWAQVGGTSVLDTPEEWRTRIGIDPKGGTDPTQLSSAYWYTYTANKGEWQQLSVSVPSTDSITATVYACAHPASPGEFNLYWDDAAFSMMTDTFLFLPVVLRDYCGVDPGELYNPDFEENFCGVQGYQKHPDVYDAVAPFWNPFINREIEDERFQDPQFNKTDRDYRKYSGGVAQQLGHSAWGLFEAGVYQVVDGVQVGDVLSFTVYGWGWIGADGNINDRISDYTGSDGLLMRIGIDPYGGEDFSSSNIVWSDFEPDPYDRWNRYEITTTAQATKVSVWIYAKGNKYGMRYHQTFWDHADLKTLNSP